MNETYLPRRMRRKTPMMVEIDARTSMLGAARKRGGLVFEALRGEVARGIGGAVVSFGLLAGTIAWNPHAADRDGSNEDRQGVVAPKPDKKDVPATMRDVEKACATKECIMNLSPVAPDEDEDEDEDED